MLFLILYMFLGRLCSSVATKMNILGGFEVNPPFKYTWMTRIVKDNAHHCTGIMVNNSTLITTSHCSKENVESYGVEIHRHDTRKLPKEENSQVIGIKSIVKHDTHDLAVWKLKTPAQHITFDFELDSGEEVLEKTLVKTLGWGWARSGGPFSKTLQEVDIPTFNLVTCMLTYMLYDRKVDPKNHICAGGEGGRDACVGDSGGPLLLKKHNKLTLVGLTSFGLPCARQGVPTVWTRVAPLNDFIQANI